MRKHMRTLAVMAAAVLVLAAGASARSGSDSVISLSYLVSVFQPDAQSRADAAAAQPLQDAYDEGMEQLDELNEDYLGAENDRRPYSADLRSRSYSRGDQVTVQAGAGLLMMAGDVSVTHNGALVDVTDGREIPSGSHLTAGHRYLAAEDTTVTCTVRSGLARLGVQGYYQQKSAQEGAAPYTDVSDTDAWAQAVDYAYDHNLLTGTGDDCFSPHISMSRAMMMTVFYRLAGSPEREMAAAAADFRDVKDGQWFAPYVRWAAGQGVTSGTNTDPPMFSPDLQVTRQEVVVMLYGFAQKSLGLELEGMADLSRYPDGSQVPFWSAAQVAWAVENGILQPNGGLLQPVNSASRAEVAMMVMAFAEKYL